MEFQDAINNTSIVSIPTIFDNDSASTLESHLKQSKVMLLGETHGVKENPDIIYTLVKRFGFRSLALEWPNRVLVAVNSFLSSGILDLTSFPNYKDGRITAGHFALLCQLQSEGLLDKLILFDVGNIRSWDDRDKQMADLFLEERDAHIPTLVVAGNLHTKAEMVNNPKYPSMTKPMGYHISNDLGFMPQGKIEYQSGEFYNLQIKSFPVLSSVIDIATFQRNAEETYVYTLPKSTAGVVL